MNGYQQNMRMNQSMQQNSYFVRGQMPMALRQMPVKGMDGGNGAVMNKPMTQCDGNSLEVCDSNVKMALYELGFIMGEMNLYLDTHPGDQEALDYYLECKLRYEQVVEKYERKYGPLTFSDVTNHSFWDWVSTPMPWEMEGC